MLDNLRLQIHTLTVCNTFCFSPATVVTRTRLKCYVVRISPVLFAATLCCTVCVRLRQLGSSVSRPAYGTASINRKRYRLCPPQLSETPRACFCCNASYSFYRSLYCTGWPRAHEGSLPLLKCHTYLPTYPPNHPPTHPLPPTYLHVILPLYAVYR